jgi:hypothetical protein
MCVTVVVLRFVNAHYCLEKMWTASAHIVTPSIGAGGKCGKPQGLIVMCNHVIYVVIFCVIVSLILFGKLAHGVSLGMNGL